MILKEARKLNGNKRKVNCIVITKKNHLITERMRKGRKTTELLYSTLKGKENILKNVTVNFNIHLETPKPQKWFVITHRK